MRNNHKPARGKARGGTLITKAQEHKITPLDRARNVLNNPEGHDPGTLEWARLFVSQAKEAK